MPLICAADSPTAQHSAEPQPAGDKPTPIAHTQFVSNPVFHGDTLTAYTQVLETRDAERADAGIVRFKHWGVKQDGTVVFEGEREVLIKRRSHWGPAA